MAAKNVGTLIREARTAKKLSQEQLAGAVDGISGSDVGKAERGEKELTQAQLKAIAKALGITQKSLLEAPKGGASSTATKTASNAKTSTAARKTTTTAKTTSTAKKTTASSKTAKATKTSDLSTTEQKLIELYRAAGSDDKKLATRILKGEKLEIGDLLMLANAGNGEDGLLGGLLSKIPGLVK